ncbi:hypothetical protein FH972_024590 [Carpinus fangiana]|uniref:Uncharacterized protein n=1 Tax=Carpinus fangiana TaxID=176857 RepID=A0A5N6KYX1_9ROSI|nr:hypothetical protein FH972_024590 [Carpinus fangiana]
MRLLGGKRIAGQIQTLRRLARQNPGFAAATSVRWEQGLAEFPGGCYARNNSQGAADAAPMGSSANPSGLAFARRPRLEGVHRKLHGDRPPAGVPSGCIEVYEALITMAADDSRGRRRAGRRRVCEWRIGGLSARLGGVWLAAEAAAEGSARVEIAGVIESRSRISLLWLASTASAGSRYIITRPAGFIDSALSLLLSSSRARLVVEAATRRPVKQLTGGADRKQLSALSLPSPSPPSRRLSSSPARDNCQVSKLSIHGALHWQLARAAVAVRAAPPVPPTRKSRITQLISAPQRRL